MNEPVEWKYVFWRDRQNKNVISSGIRVYHQLLFILTEGNRSISAVMMIDTRYFYIAFSGIGFFKWCLNVYSSAQKSDLQVLRLFIGTSAVSGINQYLLLDANFP